MKGYISRYERAMNVARSMFGNEGDLERAAKHLYAKELVGGAPMTKVDGYTVRKPRPIRLLPN